MRDESVAVQLIGGPTAVVELGGMRLLLDPTFSPPGQYEVAPGRFLTKLEGPAFGVDRLGAIDAVLLSHDQHADNLDPMGRDYLATVPTVLTTESAAVRLGGQVRGMAPWESVQLSSAAGRVVDVMAVPAQHGPEGTTHLTGEVTGFILRGDGVPTVYVSGDNASLACVRDVSQRVDQVEVAILFGGGAQSPKLLGDAYLTLTGDGLAEAAVILGSPLVVPVHYSGWAHFTQGVEAIVSAFARTGLSDRLVLLEPGTPVTLGRP